VKRSCAKVAVGYTACLVFYWGTRYDQHQVSRQVFNGLYGICANVRFFRFDRRTRAATIGR
ncbi:TPA: hypothetical protein ACMDPK_003560, partial [Vibrio cholerae]